jgi:hypothetical protein
VSSAIERPVFFENQILGAADLTATVDLGRGQQARHNRYLHLWGIAAGLELKSEKDEDKGDPYIKITLSPGVAIDGTGREIIVPKAESVSEATFSQLGVSSGSDETALFPVFLVGRDQKATQPPLLMGACTSEAATRIEEKYDITFGRPNDDRKLDEQDGVEFPDGPNNGGWKVLLGFVSWNKEKNGFVDLKPVNGLRGRRYAGVQADEVAARGGSLQLRTQTKPQDKKPAIVLDETDDGRLRFGSLNAEGKLNAVFTVNAKGDLEVTGKIKSAIAPGTTHVQSGMVMDGLLVPLPPGINPADIDSGKLTMHVHVTPRMSQDLAPSPEAAGWAVLPVECFVDSNRRVHCRVHWLPLGSSGTEQTLSAFCDYLVMVTVPASTGS